LRQKHKYRYELFQSANYLKQPIISVITPVFNNEKTIQKTIESVLQQSIMPQIEYIIVDDGSKDQTRSILKKFVNEHPNIKLALL
ncbi:glycosyltransferase, partial [Vibrio cholerae]|nr:glycosyltransferase [Vibrio cholerae]